MSYRTPLLNVLLGALLGCAPAIASSAEGTRTQDRYIVHFRAGKMERGMRTLDGRARAIRQRLERHDAVAADLDAMDVAALARDPSVASIERDPLRHPVSMIRSRPSGADTPDTAAVLTSQVVPYGVRMVQARRYPGVRTAGVRVCVIDSGYDLGHEDKPGSLRVTGNDDPGGAGLWRRDGDGHGTHVSGTINARDNLVGVVGVFPAAPMHVVKVFGRRGGWAYSSDLVAALDRCIEAGARVVNMSLGGGDPSTVERTAFADARLSGVLSIAAAGNDGDTSLSYPAAYPSVISVAAIDAESQHASFSNRNPDVALAAPGVSVLSTVPRGTVRDALLHSGAGTVAAVPMDNFPTPTEPVTAALVDCGLGATPADCGDAQGKMCLIERGTYTFAQKAENCQTAGGVAAVVFNQAGQSGPVYGTLGETQVAIPVVGTDRPTGIALRAEHLGSDATLEFARVEYDYDYYSGTSMATPHVAGVAALIWSTHTRCSNEEIEQALYSTALDLGLPGRDPKFGFGLVQTRAASTWLDEHPCAGP